MPVQLFLVRHAEAEATGELSARGRAQATALGERLRWYDCIPTQVWTSPLVRARETAQVVLDILAETRTVPIEPLPELSPHGEPSDTHARIRRLRDSAAVLVVGHEPCLSTLAGLVLDAHFAPFERAEAVRIIDGEVRWRFRWNAEAPRR